MQTDIVACCTVCNAPEARWHFKHLTSGETIHGCSHACCLSLRQQATQGALAMSARAANGDAMKVGPRTLASGEIDFSTDDAECAEMLKYVKFHGASYTEANRDYTAWKALQRITRSSLAPDHKLEINAARHNVRLREYREKKLGQPAVLELESALQAAHLPGAEEEKMRIYYEMTLYVQEAGRLQHRVSDLAKRDIAIYNTFVAENNPMSPPPAPSPPRPSPSATIPAGVSDILNSNPRLYPNEFDSMLRTLSASERDAARSDYGTAQLAWYKLESHVIPIFTVEVALARHLDRMSRFLSGSKPDSHDVAFAAMLKSTPGINVEEATQDRMFARYAGRVKKLGERVSDDIQTRADRHEARMAAYKDRMLRYATEDDFAGHGSRAPESVYGGSRTELASPGDVSYVKMILADQKVPPHDFYQVETMIDSLPIESRKAAWEDYDVAQWMQPTIDQGQPFSMADAWKLIAHRNRMRDYFEHQYPR